MIDSLHNRFSMVLAVFFVAAALLAIAGPAGATLPSWYEATAVNREGLLAAARQSLSAKEAESLDQAIAREDGIRPRGSKDVEPPLVRLKSNRFINELVGILRQSLARGNSAGVKKFFQAVNDRKLIHGHGQFYMQRGGYGGPMVIQLQLLQSPENQFQVEVWYKLVSPGQVDKERREGPRVTHPTGIAVPK